jgi:hypothetical protein
MGPENLDQGYLQSWDLSMKENAGEIQLDLETNIDIRPVDCWGLNRLAKTLLEREGYTNTTKA